MKDLTQYRVGALALLAASCAPAHAAMGHSSSLYGVLPADMASAQALSLFSTSTSALFYNPAHLTRDERGELTGAILHGDHDLRAKSQGGEDPQERDSDTINDTPTQQFLLGMKTDVSRLFSFTDHPMQFGFMVGLEKFSRELVAFESRSSEEPQFFRYERQPLFLALGAGTPVWQGISAGVSARVTLHNEASLHTTSDLEGNTERETLNVSAEPVIQPVLGVSINWGETICEVAQCWQDNLDTAFAFRAHTYSRTAVEANAVIPGTIPEPGLDIRLRTLDSFQPATWSAAVRYDLGRLRLGAALELQEWSRLEESLRRDDVKTDREGNLEVELRDVLVPRVGADYSWTNHLKVTGGLAWERSPLRDGLTPDVNYLDNDRLVLGLGGTLAVENPPLLDWPAEFGIAYQYHWLDERDFDLASDDPNAPQGAFETVTAEGHVHVFSGSVSLRF